jgi:hypothetical protein
MSGWVAEGNALKLFPEAFLQLCDFRGPGTHMVVVCPVA